MITEEKATKDLTRCTRGPNSDRKSPIMIPIKHDKRQMLIIS